MAYSNEVVKRARERLAQAKTERELENNRRLMEAYTRVPELLEIDRRLRKTMALAAQAIFAQGSDIQASMAQVRDANLTLQRKRADLIAQNFAPGWLDDTFICDDCGGSGYVGTQMCHCLQELCRQEQLKELTFLHGEQFGNFRLDVYPDRIDPATGMNIRSIMKYTYDICFQYALDFTERSGNLLFSGGTGLGKTFLSACIARVVAERGYSVCYESAAHLFANLERAKFNGDEQARQECQRYDLCDLLIVDDLGTEMPGQFTTSALYTLVNDRILAGKPTIISTNLNSEDLARRYNPQIASRLRGSFTRVAFLGEDIRLRK